MDAKQEKRYSVYYQSLEEMQSVDRYVQEKLTMLGDSEDRYIVISTAASNGQMSSIQLPYSYS